MRRQLALAIVHARPAEGSLRPLLFGILAIILLSLFLAPARAEACAMRVREAPIGVVVAEGPQPPQPAPPVALVDLMAEIDGGKLDGGKVDGGKLDGGKLDGAEIAEPDDPKPADPKPAEPRPTPTAGARKAPRS